MVKRKFDEYYIENYKRLKAMNSFNKYRYFSKKINHNISYTCRINTVNILRYGNESIDRMMNIWLSMLQDETYNMTLNDIVGALDNLDYIGDENILDMEIYEQTYDEYFNALDENIIRIQRWYRRIKFIKKLWVLIEKVVEVYYHPESKHMARLMQNWE